MAVLKNSIGPAQQWFAFLIMCATGVAIVTWSGRDPKALFSDGLTITAQALVGLGLGVAACVSSWVVYKFTAHSSTTQHTIDSYSRLNLAGWSPLWIAAAAGIGEELLFRGALQPVIGIWLSSIFFVLAHTSDYWFKSLGKKTLVQEGGCSLKAWCWLPLQNRSGFLLQ